MKKLYTVISKATSGKATIATANDVFTSYIDSDFKNWGTDKKSEKTKKMNLDVYEPTENFTYKDIFTDPDKMCLTQEQIIEFCKNHQDKLSSWCTFFLFKVDSEFFVARVRVRQGGLHVHVRGFSDDDVWDAEDGHRFVLPQLTPSDLEPDPLKLCHCDALESRVTAIENWIENVRSQLL